MRFTLVAFAAGLPLLAAILLLRNSVPRDLPDEGVAVDAISNNELPAWAREPLPFPPETNLELELAASSGVILSSDDVADIELRLLASIAENFRSSLAQQDIPTLLAEMDVRRAEESKGYWQDPAWPTISVVPGVAGFAIQQCPRSQCVSDWLASEHDDAAWARPMEARIMGEIAKQAAGGLAQMFVVCRHATCGILLPSSSDDRPFNLMGTASKLKDELGFVHYSFANRNDFQALYLTTRDQQPEMWNQ